jgi:hypothetical protein
MVHNDWDYHDPRYSRLVEVFQACRGNYESHGCFRQYSDGTARGDFALDGLRRGRRFGLIASSDHGHGASYVGVLASSLDRVAIFAGLHARRTCAATTRDIVTDLRLTVDGAEHLMGEGVSASGPRRLRVLASGYTELARVDLLRDGEVIGVLRGGPDLSRRPPGWRRVDLRIEWGGADVSTTWDGRLTVVGGELLVPDFVGPDVVHLDPGEVEWANRTHSFGEPYGAQRGGIEVTVIGPDDARVHVVCAGRDVTVRLGDLGAELSLDDLLPEEVRSGLAGELVLQPGIGALIGLGRSEIELLHGDRVDDTATGPAFYYARVFQVDGELGWSSPIWVDPAP